MIGKKWKNCLQNCFIGCMIGVLLMLTGCNGSQTNVSDEESALTMLENLQSYEAQIDVIFYSNKGENTYRVNQRAKISGQYRMEILEPESFAGVLTISDGQRIIQTDPTIGGEVEAKQTPVRDALLLYTFLDAYHSEGGSFAEGENNTVILQASYPNEHKKIASAQLTLAKGTGTPLSLEILDAEGKPSIHMSYQTFQMNPELADEDFQITSQP